MTCESINVDNKAVVVEEKGARATQTKKMAIRFFSQLYNS